MAGNEAPGSNATINFLGLVGSTGLARIRLFFIFWPHALYRSHAVLDENKLRPIRQAGIVIVILAVIGVIMIAKLAL